MFTFTGVSTDAGSFIMQARLMLVGGLCPTKTIEVCVDSMLIDDIGGTAQNKIHAMLYYYSCKFTTINLSGSFITHS